MTKRRFRAAATAALYVTLSLLTASPSRAEPPRAEPASLSHDETGFKVETEDGRYELRIFGIVQTDLRDYLDKRDRTDHERFLVRRARPYLEGHVLGGVDYRLMMDLGNGEVDLLDAFLDAKLLGSWLRFRAGKYKQPFSYEQFKMEDLTLAVFERSAIDVLAPARNVGVMFHGGDPGRRFEYALGVSNGLRDSDFEEKRNEKDVVGRVVARPFAAVPALSSLQIGVSGAYGEETDAFDPEAFSTPMRVKYFHFAEGVNAAGSRVRVSPELAYFAGPFAMAAQVLVQRQRVQNVKALAPAVTVPMTGYYGLASLVLTGEHRTSYAEFIHPRRPVSFSGGPHGTGALELYARVSGLAVSDVAFDERYHLAERDEVAGGVNELSLGLNWYLDRWVWLMATFEHAIFDRSLPLGGAGGARLGAQQALGVRATVMF